MTEDAGMVYTTQQVADRLGIGAAMLRRYAQTLEKITGEEIPQTRRDGRQFGQWHVDVLARAKGLVDNNHGLAVEAALKNALSQNGSEVMIAPILPVSSADLGELVRALQDAVTAPLVSELRELRTEVAQLRQDRQLEDKQNDVTELENELKEQQFATAVLLHTQDKAEVSLDHDGALVKIARQLERWLGRKNS